MFSLGQTVMTRGVAFCCEEHPLLLNVIQHCLARHSLGDWGDVCAEDKQANDQALRDGDRVLSSYPCTVSPDGKIWIITERDRSYTTVLFPSEY